ncbi:immunoglobulin-like domain-containing protein [Priestia megaterium]|uniref:immunoglobulin-like domain-containing protein n=1 Tax=Priestia megaterium TaxID=1404 RepID=UPI000BFE7EAD|nr:immunoglobulin-like domain-containing protein [Priestia megaterium]MDC7769165.1 DUF5011 domain-containing protein [Priestia megaterium]PGR06065.1 hypothetical protein COA23_13855 [Priestia megaterium]
MKCKCLTGVVLSSLLFSQFGGVHIKAETDTNPPSFASITVNKQVFTSGDTLQVRVSAEDIESGINDIEVGYGYGNNDYETIDLTYNQETALYEGSKKITGRSFGWNATWHVTDITLTDRVGNAIRVYNKGERQWPGNYTIQVRDLSAGTITVENNDLQAPTISNLSSDKKVVKQGEKVSISLAAVDNASDVKAVSLNLYNPEHNEDSIDYLLSYNNATKRYEAVIPVDDEWVGGKWLVNQVKVEDKNENWQWYSNKAIQVQSSDALNFSGADFEVIDQGPVVSGVKNGAYYNHDVTPTFNEGTAVINAKPFTSGTTITQDGYYFLRITDKSKNVTDVEFVIDKTPPIIKEVEDGKSYKYDVTPGFDSMETATLNSKPFERGTTITEAGDYTLKVTDKAGNETTIHFSIERGEPIFSGAEDGSWYTHDVTVRFSKGKGKLEYYPAMGDYFVRDVNSGDVYTEEGQYKIIATDKAGNAASILFHIDKTAPAISGVEDGGIYSQRVLPQVTDVQSSIQELTLNGQYYSGKAYIQTEGSYTLKATDRAGNTKTVSFVIDTTLPEVKGLEYGKTYTKPVAPTFSEGTATLDGKPFTSGTSISTHGNHTLLVTDKAGNVTRVNFTLNMKPILSGVSPDNFPLNMSFNPRANVSAKDSSGKDLTKNIVIKGEVNVKVAARYILTYSVSDQYGNVAQEERIIDVQDVTGPIFSGTDNKTIPLLSTFDPKEGVTAKDDGDGDVTKNISISGTVNTKVAGTYTLIYTVSDKYRNKTVAKRVIMVQPVDKTKPAITGADDKAININSSFDAKAGITVKDNVDGDITKLLSIKGTVNTKIKGVYTLTYSVKDKAGNTATATRRITVKDNVKPVISGAENKTISLNSKFDSKAGVTAKDNVDGDMTKSLKIEGTVNTKVKGVYILMYSVKDKSGNLTSVTRKITVADTVKPVISGATNKSIKLNSSFSARTGVTAKDNVDGDITKSMTVSGTVNTKKKGTYNLTYTSVDKSGNKTILVRKITVN